MPFLKDTQEDPKAFYFLYAGCYEFRKITEANRLSTHSWGMSVDIDSENNP